MVWSRRCHVWWLTCPLKNCGWKSILSVWNGPLLGHMLMFGGVYHDSLTMWLTGASARDSRGNEGWQWTTNIGDSWQWPSGGQKDVNLHRFPGDFKWITHQINSKFLALWKRPNSHGKKENAGGPQVIPMSCENWSCSCAPSWRCSRHWKLLAMRVHRNTWCLERPLMNIIYLVVQAL